MATIAVKQHQARAAAWDLYHQTMLPARAAFEEVRKPARDLLDITLKKIGPDRKAGELAPPEEGDSDDSTA